MMPIHAMEDEENDELDLTTTIKSNLSPSTRTITPTPSVSFSNDVPDQTLSDFRGSSSTPIHFITDSLEKKYSQVSTEKIVKKVRISIDDDLEKECQDALDHYDIQQQIRASIGSIPGEMLPSQSIQISRKRSWLFSRISSFLNFKKSDQSTTNSVKLFDAYKFADKFDIILMIIGTIAVLVVGACHPVMFHLYRQVLNSFVEYNNQQLNFTVNSTNPCFTVSNTTKLISLSQNIRHIINYYLIIGVVSILCSWIGWTCWIIASERQIRHIRFQLFRSILRQEIGWFDIHNAGELNNYLINDLDKMKDGMGEKVADFILTCARMTGVLIYGLVIGWKLILVYLSLSPFVIFLFNISIKIVVKFTVKEVKAFASASMIAHEVLQNIRTMTAFHGQEKEEQRFASTLTDSKMIGIRKGILVGLCQGLSTILSYSAFAIIIWYGPYLSRTDCSNYSAGTIVVAFFCASISTTSLSQCVPNIQNFAEAAGSGINVFDIIKRQTKIDASSDEGDKPETIKGHIEFRHVSFAYPARDEVSIINNLSFKIPAGKTVALVGPSGCGKSTIIQLIQRFYDPDNGQVFLDGKDIKKLNVSWLRSHIGIVSQEPVLFTGSIEENIRFGKQNATDEEVQNAAKMANAHEFIMALPENYKTTSGDKLSGGQKQRVAIARALISNPRILLLDEATSALDNTSERIVQDALEKAKQGRTTIVIAHRLSTIRNADLIIGLEHGEVVEYGSHDELMEKKGLYYELVTTQSQKEIEKENENESDSESDEDDETNHQLLVPEIIADRRVSRLSIFSTGSDGLSDHLKQLVLVNSSNNKGWFRTPFLIKISKYNIPEWHWILLGTIVSLIYGCSSPLYSLIFSNMYASFGESNVHEQERITRNYPIIIFCIGLGAGISQFLTSLSFSKSGEALTMRMRKLTFSAMLRQEMSYFDQESNSTGALITRLSTDASALKGLTGVRIGIILQAIGAVILGLIFSFTSSWKITLVALALSPIVLMQGKSSANQKSPDKKLKDKNSFVEQGGQYALQAIEHIRTVVALHQEKHFINLYEHTFNQEFKKQTRLAHQRAINVGISNSAMFFFHCACFGFGSQLVEKGELNYTQVYRVFYMITVTIFGVARCMTIIPDYSKAKAAAIRILKLNKRQSQIDPTDESGIILDNVIGDIEFHDVNFRYSNRPTVRVLRHFSLKCANSQTTALVGPSGGGKSTTIALLQRFYDPLNGKILLDGHDIKVLNIRWLRSLMGVVQQEPVLFNLSIRDNIAYGDNSRDITQDEIERAAQMANIHDVIISLPQGYETLCGSKGSQLSGGQKQRIAIARALIRNPKILLFDEATSALDNKSEQVVQEAIDQVRTDRTCLTIAHRLTTIKNSEKIVVINQGKITEEGTHEQLLRQNGIYAKLTLEQERKIQT